MSIVQRVAKRRSFHDGMLVEVGQTVSIDTAVHPLTKDIGGKKVDAMPNFAKVGDVEERPPTPIAAVGPTGPNPTMPQQIPPDAVQQAGGYILPGDATHSASELVAEGSVDAPEPAAAPKAKK